MKRYYLLWLYAVTLTALGAASLQSLFEERRLLKESDIRAVSLSESIEDSVLANYTAKRFGRIAKIVDRLRTSEGLAGLALCMPGTANAPIVFPKNSRLGELCDHSHVRQALQAHKDVSWIETQSGTKLHYHARELDSADSSATKGSLGVLVLAQDLSFLRRHWLESFIRTFILTWIGGVALLLLVASQIRGWLKAHLRLFHRTVLSLLAGKKPSRLRLENLDGPSELHPISRDIDKLAEKILSMSRAQDREGRRMVDANGLTNLREKIMGKQVVVIANREPYIHQKVENQVKVVRPASGLVTALEPILRLCGGLWIGHGSGSADRETVNASSEIPVPPENPRYRLRRVWLSKEEEAGYYYGFANEGLWPLCHLAHTRPIFRLSDWEQYRTVNQRFADSVPKESLLAKPLILVQDYHFALLPRMLKSNPLAARADVGLFWHIPWPNPEAFGICPWSQELLKGMLGADLIGFHTQYHCNNFLETCNRYLEARIDYEQFSVTMENHVTLVRAFPIGIDTSPVRYLSESELDELRERYQIKAKIVAVGVDRLDYTKGIIERVEAVERFLEKNPQYVGQFTLAQIGSPSRSDIPAYRSLMEELMKVVNRVNQRFGGPPGSKGGYLPIRLLVGHHEWDEIQYFYQLGDVCMVTSLHDGMNLVAKEYVWCQRPDRGSLVLSKFTGASRELNDAFIVNPYSIEEMADALAAAVALSPHERARRMMRMRERVQAHNAYHWASDLIQTLLKKSETAGTQPAEPGRPGIATLKGVASLPSDATASGTALRR